MYSISSIELQKEIYDVTLKYKEYTIVISVTFSNGKIIHSDPKSWDIPPNENWVLAREHPRQEILKVIEEDINRMKRDGN